uniref:Uncharacterized protein n=1 Tax=Setaria viridis TaxID=4556 RepID=A0A4U6VLH5_SETVI|nr:hypothetical protein SEVIR_3G372450v2 [Setaria viridis]
MGHERFAEVVEIARGIGGVAGRLEALSDPLSLLHMTPLSLTLPVSSRFTLVPSLPSAASMWLSRWSSAQIVPKGCRRRGRERRPGRATGIRLDAGGGCICAR